MLTQLLPLPTNTLSLSSLSLLSPTRLPARPSTWAPQPRRQLLPPIRMGGGPRTFPGGVSKWQWKRMQAKKAKQLLKARLLRERQTYEMRKRAELKAAVSELEKPWELVEKAPTLFSVAADEQLKALADRFQKPGGFDMWSDRDGPQIFQRDNDGSILPSRRFFPKGVVHSVKPYGVEKDEDEMGFDDWIARGKGGVRRRRRRRDGGQGVRPNADEKKDDDSECIDVEALSVGENEHSGIENLMALKPGSDSGGRRARGIRVGGRKATLRPTSQLKSDDRELKQRESRSSDGFRTSRERNL